MSVEEPFDGELSSLDLINQVIDIVSHARSVLGSASVIVNRSEVLEILETAKEVLPDQVLRAEDILHKAENRQSEADAEAEEILARAREEAEGHIQQARETSLRLVAQDSVTIAAKAQAQEILDQAKEQAAKLRRGADDYSERVLADLAERTEAASEQLEAMLGDAHSHFDQINKQIAAGRNVIAQRSQGE